MTDASRTFRLLLTIWAIELRPVALWYCAGTMALPLILAGGLRLADLMAGPERQALIIGGGGVLATLGMALLALPPFVARLREHGQVAYFAAMPIGRPPFLASLLTIFALLSLPGAILTPIITARMAGVSLRVSLLSIFVVPVVVLALCAIGLLVGLLSPGERAAHLIGLIAYMVLWAAPIFLLIPRQFPPALRWIGVLVPTGIAGDAAAGLVRNMLSSLPLDLILLALYGVLAYFGAERSLTWHPGNRQLPTAPQP